MFVEIQPDSTNIKNDPRSYAGDPIHEAFFHLGSVPLESTVADALE